MEDYRSLLMYKKVKVIHKNYAEILSHGIVVDVELLSVGMCVQVWSKEKERSLWVQLTDIAVVSDNEVTVIEED